MALFWPSGPTYCWNETYNPDGPNKCSNNVQCDGARTCSQSGYCQGESGLATK